MVSSGTLGLSVALLAVLVAAFSLFRGSPAYLLKRVSGLEADYVQAAKLVKQFRDEHLARETAQTAFEAQAEELLHEIRNMARRAKQHQNALTPRPDGADTPQPMTEEQQKLALARAMPSL